jgi:hypothetical protein
VENASRAPLVLSPRRRRQMPKGHFPPRHTQLQSARHRGTRQVVEKVYNASISCNQNAIFLVIIVDLKVFVGLHIVKSRVLHYFNWERNFIPHFHKCLVAERLKNCAFLYRTWVQWINVSYNIVQVAHARGSK